MPHNDYIMPFGKWATVAPPKALSRLDQQISEGINGDEGGTWNPSGPIAIGGDGLTAIPATITGAVRTGKGYGSPSDPRIEIASPYFPTWTTPRSRTVLLPFHPSLIASNTIQTADFLVDADGRPYTDDPAGLHLTIAIPQMRLHNGATLLSATFRWSLRARPAANTPGKVGIRGIKRGLAGYSTGAHIVRLHTASTVGTIVYDANGLAHDTFSDVDSLYAGGAMRTLVFVPNQNQVIDTWNTSAACVYQAHVSTLAAATMHSIELQFGSIADLRFE